MKRFGIAAFAVVVGALTLGFLFSAFLFSGSILTPSFSVFAFEYGYFLSIGIVIYLFLRRRPERVLPAFPEAAFRALLTAFLLLIGASILSVVGYIYERPPAYYVLSAGAVASIFLQVLGFDPTVGMRRRIILAEVLSLPVVNQISFGHVQPFLFGSDSTFHLTAASEIAASGALPGWMGPYVHFPWLHLWAASAIVSTGNVGISFVSATFLHSILALLSAYLILRRISTERAAFMGTLMVLIAPTFMAMTLQYAPTKSGLAVLFLAMWAAIRVPEERRFWGIYILMFVAAFLYHPVFGFLLVVISLTGMIATRLRMLGKGFTSIRTLLAQDRKPSPRARTPHSAETTVLAPFLFSVVAYLAYLVYVEPQLFDAVIGALTFPESQLPAAGTIQAARSTLLFVSESILNNLGMTGVLAFAIPVFWIWGKGGQRPAKRFFALTYGFMLLSISLISVGDLFLLGPVRFLGTLDLFAAMAAGPGLVLVLTRIGPSQRRLLVVAALFLGLVMVSSVSYRADANSYLSQNIPTGLGYLQEDAVASAKFLSPHSGVDTKIFLDNYMAYWIANFPQRSPFSLYNNPILPSNIHEISAGAEPSAGLYILNARSAERSGWDVALIEAKLSSSDRIYDSGNIRILASP